jgi:glycosyltransferase involved in cell wall biosynthesis
MKNVLIITRDFPPYCPVVGWLIRMASLENFFSRHGMNCTVLATGRATQHETISVDSSVEVHYVNGWLEYYETLAPLHPIRVLNKAARRIAMALFVKGRSDYTECDLKAYRRRARELIDKHNIDTVIVSTPPHSLQKVGVGLKIEYGERITLIADFRDPWTLHEQYRPKSEKLLERLQEKEKAVMEAADHVVFVCSGAKQIYEDVFGQMPKAVVVENGYVDYVDVRTDPVFAKTVDDAHDKGRIVIGFFGSTGASKRKDGKGLKPLLDVLAADAELARRVHIVTQGPFSDLKKVPRTINLTSLPTVDNRTARGDMALCDVGLVVYTEKRDAAALMGGKLYDYIAAGIPIWIIAASDASSYREFVQRTGKPFFSDVENDVAIANTLRELLDKYSERRLSDHVIVDDHREICSRNRQYEKFLRL